MNADLGGGSCAYATPEYRCNCGRTFASGIARAAHAGTCDAVIDRKSDDRPHLWLPYPDDLQREYHASDCWCPPPPSGDLGEAS